MNTERTLVATGEVGKKPKVYIWTANNAQKVSKIKLGRVRGVKTIGWSMNSKYVACTCLDNDHTVYLLNPKQGKGKVITSGKGGDSPFYD